MEAENTFRLRGRSIVIQMQPVTPKRKYLIKINDKSEMGDVQTEIPAEPTEPATAFEPRFERGL